MRRKGAMEMWETRIQKNTLTQTGAKMMLGVKIWVGEQSQDFAHFKRNIIKKAKQANKVHSFCYLAGLHIGVIYNYIQIYSLKNALENFERTFNMAPQSFQNSTKVNNVLNKSSWISWDFSCVNLKHLLKREVRL